MDCVSLATSKEECVEWAIKKLLSGNLVSNTYLLQKIGGENAFYANDISGHISLYWEFEDYVAGYPGNRRVISKWKETMMNSGSTLTLEFHIVPLPENWNRSGRKYLLPHLRIREPDFNSLLGV